MFATVTVRIAAGEWGPLTIYLDPTPGTGSLLFTSTGAGIPIGGYVPFGIPEPAGALLLLAGLPLLLRRR